MEFRVEWASNFSVREVISWSETAGQVPDSGTATAVEYNLNGAEKTIGFGANPITIDTNAVTSGGNGLDSLWITAEDGISYKFKDYDGTCSTKNTIFSALGTTSTYDNIADNSCMVAVVDVNGINKKPNTLEVQSTGMSSDQVMETLTGDQFYIFIAKDGVTPGNKLFNVGARIMADVK